MSPIELLSEDAIELTHSPAQVGFNRFNKQMVVVLHQHIRMTKPMKAFFYLLKSFFKALPVSIIQEYFFSFISPRSDMVNRPGEFNAHWPGHDFILLLHL